LMPGCIASTYFCMGVGVAAWAPGVNQRSEHMIVQAKTIHRCGMSRFTLDLLLF
jgi:hypothetical protein